MGIMEKNMESTNNVIIGCILSTEGRLESRTWHSLQALDSMPLQSLVPSYQNQQHYLNIITNRYRTPYAPT